MFTGIVAGRGVVRSAADAGGLRRLRVALPPEADGALAAGASVAIAGVCLTVVGWAAEGGATVVDFDVIDETLRRTTLGALRAGDAVNVERAAKVGAEIGGHLVSGHVSGTAAVAARAEPDGNLALTWVVDPAHRPYVLEKGFVALDGCSLTVGAVTEGGFSVHLIPETRRLTTLGALRVGDRANLELDAQTVAIVDTVERVAPGVLARLLPGLRSRG